MSLAFLYPGEGSQRAGMAAALQATDQAALDHWFGVAEDVAGLPVWRLCLLGELHRPDVGEPALLALALALTEVARAEGIEPDFVAGQGLGEYAAAAAAGVLSGEDAMRLVVLRSRLLGAAREDGGLAEVRAALARRSAALTWRPARVPLASTAFGALVRDPEAVRAALIAQDPSGWADSLQALIAGGASSLLVLGPGEGLAHQARILRPELLATTADARADFAVPAAA